MTRIALIADVHVANHKRWGGNVVGGLNQRGWECIAVLKQASELARRHSCAALFVLGDLFDHTRPTPPIVAATIMALKTGGVPVHILLGNHDRQSMHELDQACASMNAVDGIRVHSEPAVINLGRELEVGVVPYVAEDAKDWLVSGMAAIKDQWASPLAARAVLTHVGIWDEDTPAYMKAGKDAVGIGHVRWLCDAHGVHFFAAGNWHDQRSWHKRGANPKDPVVVIPGTACPHNFSDPQEHGKMVFYDARGSAWTTVDVPSPFFVKVDLASHRETSQARVAGLIDALKRHYRPQGSGRAYVRVNVRSDQVSAALELKAVILQEWPQTIIHIDADEVAANASVKEAARAAVRAGEGSSSLVEYSELAGVEEPGTKEGVAARLAAYRKAAG